MFEIDVNSILIVLVEDKGIGSKNKIMIQNDNNRILLEEIEKMIKDVEIFVEEDKWVKEIVDVKNDLEYFVYLLKNQISDKGQLSEKLSEDDKKVIQEVVEFMISWIEFYFSVEFDEFKEKKLELENIV